MDEKTLLQLKKKVENARDEKSRAEGALQQLQARLKDEFGVKNEEEAEKLLDKMKGELEKVRKDLDKVVTELEDTYGI